MKKVISVFLVVICCFSMIVGVSASEIVSVINENTEISSVNYFTEEYISFMILESISSISTFSYNPYDGIYTTGGILVNYAYLYQQDFTMTQAKDDRDLFLAMFVDDFEEVYVSSGYATNSYNCHAYAWYKGSKNKPGWIEYPYSFYEDVHCIPILNKNDIQEGDIAVYVNTTIMDNHNGQYYPRAIHSAVIDDINSLADENFDCISKCGERGLYRHNINAASRLYNYNDIIYYRYAQGEHNEEYNAINSTQHTLTCSAEKNNVYCHYYEVHTTNYTSLGGNSHRAYCSQCDYDITENHDFYIYQDNGESGVTIKCNLCGFVKSCNIGVAEYVYGGQDGHYVDCSCGCYSFFAAHVPSIIMQTSSLSYHNALCKYCGEIYPAAHSWVPKNYGYVQGYECLMCDMFSISIPGVMQIPPSDELLIATSDDLVTEDALLPEKEDDLVTE